jgi:hypothetical protein
MNLKACYLKIVHQAANYGASIILSRLKRRSWNASAKRKIKSSAQVSYKTDAPTNSSSLHLCFKSIKSRNFFRTSLVKSASIQNKTKVARLTRIRSHPVSNAAIHQTSTCTKSLRISTAKLSLNFVTPAKPPSLQRKTPTTHSTMTQSQPVRRSKNNLQR